MQVIVALVCFTLARVARVSQIPFHWCDGGLNRIEVKLTLLGAVAWGKARAE